MLQVRSMVRTVPQKVQKKKETVFCKCMCWKQDLVLDKRFTVVSVHRHTYSLNSVTRPDPSWTIVTRHTGSDPS